MCTTTGPEHQTFKSALVAIDLIMSEAPNCRTCTKTQVQCGHHAVAGALLMEVGKPLLDFVSTSAPAFILCPFYTLLWV